MNKRIYIAYHPDDSSYLQDLVNQLAPLKKSGLIAKIWHKGLIESGQDIQVEVRKELLEADILLKLISSDYLAIDDNQLEEHVFSDQIKAQPIAIIVRPCLWEATIYGKWRAIPNNGTPITSPIWTSPDEPFLRIAVEIEKFILQSKSETLHASTTPSNSFLLKIKAARQAESELRWVDAQKAYKEAIELYQSGFEPSVAALQQAAEMCENQVYCEKNLSWGKKEYEQKNYAEAIKFFDQALAFRPNDPDILKLRNAAERGNKPTTIATPSPTTPNKPKGFRLKIFGIEIINIAMFALLAATVTTVFMWNQPSYKVETNKEFAFEALDAGNIEDIIIDTSDNVRIKDKEIVLTQDSIEQKVISNHLAVVAVKEPSEGMIAAQNEEGKWAYTTIKKVKEKGVTTKMQQPAEPVVFLQEVTAFKYDQVWAFTEEEKMAYAKKDGKCTFISQDGKELFPIENSPYIDAASFSEGLALVQKTDQSFAFINTSGKIVIDSIDGVQTRQFKKGQVGITRGGKQMTINSKGECIKNCPTKKAIDVVKIKTNIPTKNIQDVITKNPTTTVNTTPILQPSSITKFDVNATVKTRATQTLQEMKLSTLRALYINKNMVMPDEKSLASCKIKDKVFLNFCNVLDAKAKELLSKMTSETPASAYYEVCINEFKKNANLQSSENQRAYENFVTELKKIVEKNSQ